MNSFESESIERSRNEKKRKEETTRKSIYFQWLNKTTFLVLPFQELILVFILFFLSIPKFIFFLILNRPNIFVMSNATYQQDVSKWIFVFSVFIISEIRKGTRVAQYFIIRFLFSDFFFRKTVDFHCVDGKSILSLCFTIFGSFIVKTTAVYYVRYRTPSHWLHIRFVHR